MICIYFSSESTGFFAPGTALGEGVFHPPVQLDPDNLES